MHNSDPLLLYLVGNFELLANDGHKTPRVQLELYVGGAVILGELISRLDFQKESNRVMKALFKIHDDVIDEAARRGHTTYADVDSKIPVFLHLRGVEIWPHNFVSPGSDAPSTEFWRVRISSVDAFHISESYELERA